LSSTTKKSSNHFIPICFTKRNSKPPVLLSPPEVEDPDKAFLLSFLRCPSVAKRRKYRSVA